jgi:hypothetical protein
MGIRAAGLLFCDRLHRITETGNLTLAGIFTRLRVTNFPSPEQHLVLYALLVGDPGEQADAELVCVEGSTGNALLKAKQSVQMGDEGKRSVAVFFEGFRYPRPGDYRFTLTCNGQVIAEQTLAVVEVP